MDSGGTTPGRKLLDAEGATKVSGSARQDHVDTGEADTIRLEDSDALAEGAVVGRYVVARPIGRGGMGVVYAATDPQLNRKVAIKVVRPDLASRESRLAQRFLREAQAMAQLSHPNVVTVYEVGEASGKLFIAMELLEGMTLRAWLKDEQRSENDILEVMAQAGQGLQAAHDAGIVHRDLKPDNIYIGDDGRVRVMDFGLAGIVDGTWGDSTETWSPKSSSLTDSSTRMTTGVFGTPRYMAPEQVKGQPASALSDQFSLCVTLYESIVGRPPFEGDDIYDISVAVKRGLPEKPPVETRISRRSYRALRRGLRMDPASRWDSVQDLMSELSPKIRRTRTSTVLVVAVLVGAGGFTAAHTLGAASEQSAGQACDSADTGELSGLWNDQVALSIRKSFEASDVPGAKTLGQRVTAIFDSYAEQLVAARSQACRDTRVSAKYTEAMLDRRLLCLEQRTFELQAAVDLFQQARPAVVHNAMMSLGALGSIDSCAPGKALVDSPPAPVDPDKQDHLRKAQELLAHARALFETDIRYQDTLETLDKARLSAKQADYPSIRAEIELLYARVSENLGLFDDANRSFTQALIFAEKAASDPLRAEIYVWLGFLSGFEQANFAEAHRWNRMAEAVVSDLESSDRLEALRMRNLGAIRYRQGDYAGAESAFSKSLEIYQRLEQRSRNTAQEVDVGLRIVEMQQSVGSASLDQGDVDRAFAWHKQAQDKLAALELNDMHPAIADLHNNIGNALVASGRFDEAKERYQSALTILRASRGTSHPRTAVALANLGQLAFVRQRNAQARRYFQQALEIETRAFRASHPSRAVTLWRLGDVSIALGQHDKARGYLEQSLAEWGSLVTLNKARTRLSYARVLDRLGESDRSRQEATQSLNTMRALKAPASEVDEVIALLRGL